MSYLVNGEVLKSPFQRTCWEKEGSWQTAFSCRTFRSLSKIIQKPNSYIAPNMTKAAPVITKHHKDTINQTTSACHETLVMWQAIFALRLSTDLAQSTPGMHFGLMTTLPNSSSFPLSFQRYQTCTLIWILSLLTLASSSLYFSQHFPQ